MKTPPQVQLFLRLCFIGLLMLLLQIPLWLIIGTVRDRQTNQSAVERDVASSLAGDQRVGDPVLVVQYIEREAVTNTDDRGRETKKILEHPRQTFFIADRASFDATAEIETRYRGLYKANVFRNRGNASALFRVPVNLGLSVDPSMIVPGEAWLAWPISDVRGLSTPPVVTWNGKTNEPQPGARFDPIGEGFHVPLGRFNSEDATELEVSAKLEIAGTRGFQWVPLARTNKVTLRSAWPHPSFNGSFLPVRRAVGPEGFKAEWEVSHLSSKNVAMLMNGVTPNERERRTLEAFGVNFIEPVNVYLLAERATKYGLLFIALIFGGFFLFETLKDLRMHPLQYGLVGLAIAVFFLLLIGLTEHISFALAYVGAAVACTALLTMYLAAVLRGWARAVGFGVKLALLFGVLYGLLLSEDNALLMGSVLVFVCLAAVMLLTRKIDWYAVGKAAPAMQAPS
jgi:inner membrane protein